MSGDLMESQAKGLLSIINESVGRKILVAVTGFFMVLFVVAHLAGNLTIWGGPDWINAYGHHLHRLPFLLWSLRIIMLVILGAHVFLGVILTLENWKAGHARYAVVRRQRTTFPGRTMIFTGFFLFLFLVYHVLHFSLHLAPGVLVREDGFGRLDIYSMIVDAFASRPVAAVYFAAVFVLFLHTSHGVLSLFQTLGLANDRTLPKLGFFAKFLSAVFLVGFGLIPFLASFAVLN